MQCLFRPLLSLFFLLSFPALLCFLSTTVPSISHLVRYPSHNAISRGAIWVNMKVTCGHIDVSSFLSSLFTTLTMKPARIYFHIFMRCRETRIYEMHADYRFICPVFTARVYRDDSREDSSRDMFISVALCEERKVASRKFHNAITRWIHKSAIAGTKAESVRLLSLYLVHRSLDKISSWQSIYSGKFLPLFPCFIM